MVGYSSLFGSVLGLVTKNIEQLCEERNRSSHFLPSFRDQKPETTVPKPSIRIAHPMWRLGDRLYRQLMGGRQIRNLEVNLVGWKIIDQNLET